MILLNLTLAEFLWLLAAAWGLAVALYLLDRSRRRVVVSAIRLWGVLQSASIRKRRWRIKEPWSLALQLAAVLLILAALAGLDFRSAAEGPRDHVLVLDGSAWMAARGAAGSLLDEAKTAAISWVRSLPAGDRAMIVNAAALAAPATGFESDREPLEAAIRRSSAGFTSLKLATALEFAREALRSNGRAAGEIVYAGAGRIPRQDLSGISTAGVRVLPLSEPGANCGLREITLRRVDDDPEAWEIYVAVRNYGRTERTAPMVLQFAGTLIGSHDFRLAAGTEEGARFRYRGRTAGWIDARLLIDDSLATDNQARVEIPAQPLLTITVYTRRAGLLRPVLAATPNVRAVFAAPEAYSPAGPARLVILDGFVPARPPDGDAIWIRPGAGSPFEVAATLPDAKLTRWHGENPLGAGLRTTDVPLRSAQVFVPKPGDLAVADCAAGPVILARPGEHRAVVFGVDPLLEPVRSELSVPLVFANILRWMAPDVFRRQDWNGGRAGPVTATLDPGTDPASVRVLDEQKLPLPFTAGAGSIRFFAAKPGTVLVTSPNRESVYSQTLPDVADGQWTPAASLLRPPAPRSGPRFRDTWVLFAFAGLLAFTAEWLLFGSRS